MICSHPVVYITRTIKDRQQHYMEEYSSVDLFHDKIITPTEKFSLEDIHDVSYRRLSDAYGFFYLHTVKGVYTYTVKTSPEPWMAEYKKLKN